MKCRYCDTDTGDKYEVCPNCADWLRKRENPMSAVLLGFTFDGGTLTQGDVMKEMDCGKGDANLIINEYGFKANKYRGISLRELRYRRYKGDIEQLLNRKDARFQKSICDAIALLEENGYTVKKEEGA